MSREHPVWKADLGDGRYQNPILYADYSDPDVIRVGEDYFLVASSFCNTPAIPLLHSRDLVNWKVVNYILEQLPFPDYDQPAHGRGVWAPAIRYHDGKFWVFFPMPDEGIFFCTATDPFGRWSDPVPVRLGKGWIDPCPFWDDDGRAYLVSAFAKSRIGIKSILNLAEMKPDGTGLLNDGRHIFDGHNTQPTIEGPKLYKRDGFYYILAPAGGVENGWQTALRARNIWGPYEEKIVMFRGDTPVNGPHQGGLVDTPSGESWFIHFQDAGALGRILHLQPVQWVDGWPIIGEDAGGDGIGVPVLSWHKPDTGVTVGGENWTAPDDSDDFSGKALGLQWQWNANHRQEWYRLGEEGLTLYAYPRSNTLDSLPQLLLQKFPGPDFQATAALEISGLEEGETAGLMVLGGWYAGLALRRREGQLQLLQITGRELEGEQRESVLSAARINGTIYLRLTVQNSRECSFSYSIDNTRFVPAGSPLLASRGRWVGAKMGLFCMAPGETVGKGYVKAETFLVNGPF